MLKQTNELPNWKCFHGFLLLKYVYFDIRFIPLVIFTFEINFLLPRTRIGVEVTQLSEMIPKSVQGGDHFGHPP